MIFCFSGMGNTRYVAGLLAEILDEKLHEFTSDELLHPDKIKLSVKSLGSHVIWAFPTYGWLVPPVMEKVIQNIPIDAQNVPHYMLTTCGDDMGMMDQQWATLMRNRVWVPRGAYAVRMPNTYVFMPGFDVDKPEVIKEKLDAVPTRVKEIAEAIRNDVKKLLIPGALPHLKSDVLGALFRKFYMSPKPFHCTEACVGCGICARSCPMANIVMLGGHPQWSVNCAFCLRCYHVCPHHAVAYGRQTAKKGQYRNLLQYVIKED